MLSGAAYPLLIAAGLVAGFLNTLAGGGSLLTLPALIFIGLDANVANGTNRVAVLLQSLMAVAGFTGHRRVSVRRTLAFIPATALGAVAGARVAVEVPAPILKSVLGAVLLLALPAVFIPQGRTDSPPDPPEAARAGHRERQGGAPARQRWLLPVLFGIGFYGGFIQAGVGFLILGVLVPLAGFDLVSANALKVVLVLAYTALALPIFLDHGQVDPLSGLVLGASSAAGAWVGARFAVLRGVRFVRWVLLAALLLSAAVLLDLPARWNEWAAGR